MAPRVHRILSADVEAGIGECAHCGPVELALRTRKGRTGPVCGRARAAQRNSPNRHTAPTRTRPSYQALVRPHGLTNSEAADYIAGKACEVCGETERLTVDHCHRQGHIRGALCNSCNLGLGWFRDDPDRLEAAARYLRRTAETPVAR